MRSSWREVAGAAAPWPGRAAASLTPAAAASWSTWLGKRPRTASRAAAARWAARACLRASRRRPYAAGCAARARRFRCTASTCRADGRRHMGHRGAILGGGGTPRARPGPLALVSSMRSKHGRHTAWPHAANATGATMTCTAAAASQPFPGAIAGGPGGVG